MAKIDVEELLNLVQQKHLDAVKAIEDEAVRVALESRFTEMDNAVKTATSDWVKAYGTASADGEAGAALNAMISRALSSINTSLKGLGPGVQSALQDAVAGVVTSATEQATEYVAGVSGRTPHSVAVAAPEVGEEVAALTTVVDDAAKGAKKLLKPNLILRLGLRGLLSPLSIARRALTSAKSTISVTVNKSVDKTMQAVAKANGTQEVWVPERDACVRCTAYAGKIVTRGADFEGGLSWDPKQKDSDAPGVRPPLHPNCRCRTVPWKESWATPGTVSFPQAVRREAERSIARGFSLPTESNAARIRALKELLSGSPDLPKTVLANARRAAAKGEFPKGRDVPSP